MSPGLADRLSRRGRWLTIVSVASILGWTVPALLMLDKGFAVQDEGTYVLSYRFWDTNPYFVSGAQYFFGPLFEGLGESIPLLRLVRLLMVLGANAWFGWTFVSWLSHDRDGLLPSSRTSLVLLLTATGGMSYLWAPLTPGYYDLTADASLAMVSLLLMTLTRSQRPPPWIPVIGGVVAVVLVLTKWTAFPVVVLTVGVAAVCLVRRSRSGAVRYVLLSALGVLVALLICQVFVVPLGRGIPILWRTSSLSASGSHGVGYLARANLASTASLLLGAVILGLPLMIGLFAAQSASRRGRAVAARRWLTWAALLTAVLPFAAGWHGGADRGRVVFAIGLAGLLVAAMAGVLSRPPPQLLGGRSSRWVACTLLVVPLAQAAGTNVPLLYVAFECLAMWAALVVMLVAHADCPRVASSAVLADVAVLVVATAMICGSTTLVSPFKTTGIDQDTVRVPSLGLSVSPVVAREYGALVTALHPYVVPGATPMFTLDQKAGLTYLLGGVPVGSTWTNAVSPTATAGILELACRNGDVSTTRKPVLIFDRRLDRDVVRAMGVCGFGYPDGYRPLAVPGGPPGLSVFVPDP